jgi:ATP/maltotriose-dependent transcriptional regulator MalT
MSFDHRMAEIDALNELRLRDPVAALARLETRQADWLGLSAAQEALLRARLCLQKGSALIMLGEQERGGEEMLALEAMLRSPVLAHAEPTLRDKALRCGVACANARASLAYYKGDFAGSLRAYQQSLDLARAIGEKRFEAHTLNNLANAFEESGLPAEALEHLQAALVIAQNLAMTELAADIRQNMGNALIASGRLEPGLACHQSALQDYAALNLTQKRADALVALADGLLQASRWDEAEQALRQRQALAGNFVEPRYEARAAWLQGRIAVARGDGTAARLAFAQALAVSEGQLGDVVGQARTQLELAKLNVSENQLEAARQHARCALRLLSGSHAHRDQMHAHGLLSQIAKASGDLAQALSHHEAFHAGYERCFNEEAARKAALLAVRHEVDMARTEAERQRVENARLSEALAEIGARLQAKDTAAPARPAAATGWQDLQGLGLTPREAEVLYWVTHGKTNEEVMQILSVSVSAVKKHLGRIFDKLGVENRTAAANAARRAQGT